ncbi:hypothetical protein KBB06_05655, partial [Candidatus Gracilibacteria bacterium]|nr:hypothetical protein [Candidatus Gracilibacteria bacterium]
SYLIFDLDNLGDSDKKMLTPDTLKWLENKEAIKSLQNRIMTGVKQDAAISFGLTMDDFVDSKPKDNSTGESQQFTGTQQSTQQPKV